MTARPSFGPAAEVQKLDASAFTWSAQQRQVSGLKASLVPAGRSWTYARSRPYFLSYPHDQFARSYARQRFGLKVSNVRIMQATVAES